MFGGVVNQRLIVLQSRSLVDIGSVRAISRWNRGLLTSCGDLFGLRVHSLAASVKTKDHLGYIFQYRSHCRFIVVSSII